MNNDPMIPKAPVFTSWHECSSWMLDRADSFPQKARFAYAYRLINLCVDFEEKRKLEAATKAGGALAARHQQRRQIFLDRQKALLEEAERAEREFKQVDHAYLEVRKARGKQWEAAILALKQHESTLQAFEEQNPLPRTPQRRERLQHPGKHLEEAWFHSKAAPTLQKQIVDSWSRKSWSTSKRSVSSRTDVIRQILGALKAKKTE